MDIYLKPEEIQIAIDDSYGWGVVEIIPTEEGIKQRELSEHTAIAKASADNAVRVIREWEDEFCYDHIARGVRRRWCSECRQELKKLTEVK